MIPFQNAFTTIASIIGFLFTVLAAFLNQGALLVYLIVVKFFYAMITSMVIHRWGENNVVFIETEKNQWTTYLDGIPVKQVTNDLKNIHFSSEAQLIKKYRQLISIKIALMLAIFVFSLQQIYQSNGTEPASAIMLIGGIGAAFLLFKLQQAYSLLMLLNNNRWQINKYYIGEKIYYSAFIKDKNEYGSMLSKVFS